MMRGCVFSLLVLTGWAGHAWCLPEPLLLTPGDVIVSEYGVRGDGKTDDTEALQRIASSLENHPGMFIQQNWGGGSSLGSFPRVLFPSGEYVISETIIWPKWVTIVGLGNVVIRQTVATKDVFYFHWGWRVRLFNLHFVGGKRQVKIWGNDTDGLILIAGCRFTNAGEWGIENLMFQRGGASESAGGYVRDENDELRDIGNPDKPHFFNSTMMNVIDCEFTDCRGVINANTDWTKLNRITVRAGPSMGEAAIRNSCMMQIQNSTFEFTGDAGQGRSWIEQRKGQLTISNVKTQGSEQGAMPLVASMQRFHIPRPTGTQNAISIDGGTFQLGRGGKVPLVQCVQVPNLLSISNSVSEFAGSPAIGFPGGTAHEGLPENPTFLVKVVFGSGNRNLDTEVPSELARFVYENATPMNVDWKWPGIVAEDEAVSTEMQWMQSPMAAAVPPKGLREHSQWLQSEIDKAVAAAGSTVLPRLVIAPGVYRLNSPLAIPPRFRLESAGMALLKVIEPGIPALTLVDPRDVSISSLIFEGGTNTASLTAKPGVGGRVVFFSCYFWYAQGAAIRAKVASGPATGALPSLVADHCYFGTSYTSVVSDFPTVVENCYVSTRILEPSPDRGFSGAVFWANGPLVLRNLLMVPVVKTREVDYSWVVSRDGRVDMDWVRIGAEYGGISAIKVLADAPHALLRVRDTWLYTLINNRTRSSLYLERPPEKVIVVNNTGGPELSQTDDRVFIRFSPDAGSIPDPHEWLLHRGNTFPIRLEQGDRDIPFDMEMN